MVKKIKFIVYPHVNKQFVRVDGKLYMTNKRMDKEDFRTKAKATYEWDMVEIDEKAYEREILEIAKKLAPKVDVMQILMQALRELPIQEVKQVKRELQKKKPRVRREQGCVMLTVGKNSLMLRN
jgi:hypothetical protein